MFELIVQLEKFGVIQTGEFTLKSGKKSDLYFDLRKLYGCPKGLKNICDLLYDLITEDFDIICGVPLGAIPFVTNISVENNIPMIILRKERKEYGGKNLIEGPYKKGDRVILIEDVITTGSSIKESEEKLKAEGLEVVQKIVIINRSSSPYDSILTEQEIRNVLNIPSDMMEREFSNEMATKLWKIVLEKRTNICLSADVDHISDIVKLLKLLGDHICMIKIHWDILNDGIYQSEIFKIANEKNVLILDDRKYADIDSIVKKQYLQSKNSDAVTVHSIFGQGTIDGIKNTTRFQDSGIFLIAESSAKNNLIDLGYSIETQHLAEENTEYVSGFICQGRISYKFLNLTPGIHLDKTEEGKQGYKTPKEAIRNGSDILIVGRGIYKSQDPLKTCLEYKHVAWKELIRQYN